ASLSYSHSSSLVITSFLIIRRPLRSPLFPTRRSSDLICRRQKRSCAGGSTSKTGFRRRSRPPSTSTARSRAAPSKLTVAANVDRSEEHTSELQSLTNLVCRLLLEKKKTPT